MRIVFFGNHLYGHHALYSLINAGYKPSLVITNIPKNDEKVWYPSVSDLSEKNGIRVIKMNKVSNNCLLNDTIIEHSPDLFIVSSFRNLLDQKLLDIPKYGALNLHMAPLPKHRGAHPENWAIINGELAMGYVVHYIDNGIDSGDIVLRGELPIYKDDTIMSLTYRLADAAPPLLIKAISKLINGSLHRYPQDEKKSSFYPPRTASDGLICWNNDASTINNLVRSLVRPYPGAFSSHKVEKIIIWSTSIEESVSDCDPGCILEVYGDGGFLVKTRGNTSIRVIEWESNNKVIFSSGNILDG